MKKIALISAIALSSLFYNHANAQVRLRFGFNFGPRPVYAPVRVVAQPAYAEPSNYDGDEDYYYLPDVDAYYSVPEQCYYYNDGGEWVSAAYLPGAYRDYDWRSARRFEVRASRPFMHNDYYRERYSGVNFGGRWNRSDTRVYANDARFNQDQYRRDDNGFDNHSQYDQNSGQHNFDRNRGQDSHGFDQNRGQQHFDQNRNNNSQHFDQRDNQRSDRGSINNHRHSM